MEIILRPRGFFRVDKENKTLQFTRLTYTTMPIPPDLLNFDRLNRQKRSAIYRLGDGNLMLMREKVLFVRDRMVTPNRVIKAEYFKFLSTLFSNGIRFRLYMKKNLAALVCYEQSHTYSYEGIPPEKLMIAMEEMEYKVSIYDNIPGLVKKKQIRFEGA